MTGFEPAASCSQSRRATNCATPGYLVVGWPGRILPKQARYQLRYTRLWNCFICGLSCGLGRLLTNGFAELVPASGSVPAGCGIGPFPSWMGGICSQSRRATNCATPGYEVVGWHGRFLPKQARYQLRYTRIFNLLHDSTRGKKNQAITAIKCSNIFDDFFLYLEYNTATTSKALEEFSLEKAERRH